MSLPEALQRELGEEDPVARVGLGGDDELFVTPTRTLIYRAEGLLSDESVESYPHDAERLTVTEKRRKAKLTLDYGLDGERSVSVPRNALDDVLHPVLAGVLAAADTTDPGETVERTFRFSELTLVVTSRRLVKHVGSAVWDDEAEEYHYDDVTDVNFEEGSVSTSVVLSVDGRQERFKTPSDETRALRETLTQALFDHHGVRTLSEFRESVADDEPEHETGAESTGADSLGTAGDDEVDFGGGPDPLSADPAEVDDPDNATRADDGDADTAVAGAVDGAGSGESAGRVVSEEAGTGGAAGAGGQTAAEEAARAVEREPDAFADSEFEAAAPEDDLAEEVAELRRTVEDQQRELARQSDLIEQLIEELRRGR
ncbi:hypothetical protein RYH80_03825 [Halobaculum sp. MBLA0147]|uniref:DUF7115 domain-containing protein n=1 Tax=Halobaculum sp. MBLA0147 TaxID=3079934 RepID=UPI0035240271